MIRDLVYSLGVGLRVPGALYSEIALVEASSQLKFISAFIYISVVLNRQLVNICTVESDLQRFGRVLMTHGASYMSKRI